MENFMLLIFIFVIAAFLGVELISKVPSQLHTPLMSGTNAISGITMIGAVAMVAVSARAVDGLAGMILSFVAVVLATINVVAGYIVTDRMLGMFKNKGGNK
jgi:NAD(P) transhydrogenase subunit alpha